MALWSRKSSWGRKESIQDLLRKERESDVLAVSFAFYGHLTSKCFLYEIERFSFAQKWGGALSEGHLVMQTTLRDVRKTDIISLRGVRKTDIISKNDESIETMKTCLQDMMYSILNILFSRQQRGSLLWRSNSVVLHFIIPSVKRETWIIRTYIIGDGQC